MTGQNWPLRTYVREVVKSVQIEAIAAGTLLLTFRVPAGSGCRWDDKRQV